MAPDSAAAQQAVSFAVFGLISRQPEWSRSLFEHSIKELHDAGHDAEESKAAFLRLLASVEERRTSWQRRSRQRFAAKVIEQLRALQEQQKARAPGARTECEEVTGVSAFKTSPSAPFTESVEHGVRTEP